METCRSGPFLDEDGCSKYLWFVYNFVPLPISPLLSNPDETQSWIVVDYKNYWFTWVPLCLLKTVESSNDQAKKMFKFMSTCSVTHTIANLDAIDDLTLYLHELFDELIDYNDEPTVFRVTLWLAEDSSDEDSNDDMDYVPNEESLYRPATKEFIKSKLFRFKIEVDKDGDHNDPCSICLEDFHAKCGELLARMHCLHVFHEVCITKWLKTSETCPLCKLQVECENIRYVFDISDDVSLEEFGEDDISNWSEDMVRVFVIQK